VSDRSASPLGTADWERINELFHVALTQPPAARAAFLDAECDDPVIRAEVISLLAAHEHASGYLDSGELMVPPSADAHTLVGRNVGQYRIERVLGEGGMGVVYLAEDTRLGRTVALKAVAARHTGDESRRDRLRREARAAAALSHPGIATVYALEEIDGQVFIAGEYVPGETLRDELARGPLDIARAIATALDIARALAAAHDRGVIHRDLKPENVIRPPDGSVKILDFGLARFRDIPPALARLTDDGTILGTPAYMSPEQIRGATVDARSDLFALGIIFYELLSGHHPFAGADPSSTIARILENEPPRLAGRSDPTAPMVPPAIEEVVLTCLRKAPDARYRSVHDFVRALERLRHATPSGSRSGADFAAPAWTADSTLPARWWWQFHQAVASVVSLSLLAPLWIARGWIAQQVDRVGGLIFTVALIAALVSATLRWHLWFTLRSYPEEWRAQATRLTRWVRAADALFVIALLVTALLVYDPHEAMAIVLVAAAVAITLSLAVIEPATTHAAFRD
jgi:serine/threonine protein kinase